VRPPPLPLSGHTVTPFTILDDRHCSAAAVYVDVVDDDVVLVIIVVALSVVPLDGAELVVVACVSVAFFVVAFVVVSLCACMSWCRCSVPSRQSVAVPRCHCRRVTLSSLCRPW